MLRSFTLDKGKHVDGKKKNVFAPSSEYSSLIENMQVKVVSLESPCTHSYAADSLGPFETENSSALGNRTLQYIFKKIEVDKKIKVASNVSCSDAACSSPSIFFRTERWSRFLFLVVNCNGQLFTLHCTSDVASLSISGPKNPNVTTVVSKARLVTFQSTEMIR